MTLDEILDVTSLIPVVAEAVIDTTTFPCKGMTKIMTGERVLIWANLGYSGYEQEVKKRLTEADKSPDGFEVGPLPWGERIGNTAIIRHGDNHYLQCLSLRDGTIKALIGKIEIDPNEIPDLFLRDKHEIRAGIRQGLDPKNAVVIRTYNINNINRLVLATD